jgi:hypothetical protein
LQKPYQGCQDEAQQSSQSDGNKDFARAIKSSDDEHPDDEI